MNNEIAVVGGGAAGMMAAIAAAERGARVTLLEPNERLGKKLNITGKGRCNVTNNCSMEELLANIPRNGRFLWSAFSRFNAQDAMVFFEELGVPREGALYVGDSEVDVETARRSGLDLVGVSWGFRGRELLRQAGAEHIADSVQQLWEFVR